MNAPQRSALAGRSALVTGHTGFKGSWLAIWLHRLGAKVSGYALPPPTAPSNFVASGVGDLLTRHYEADVRDFERLSAALEESAPEVVFHLAAQPLVRDSYALPRETFAINALGTVNLLEGVRRLGRPCVVVVVTSDKCYENCGQVWGYREIDRLGGHDPYSASKGMAEIAAASYRRSFFPADRLGEHGVKLATARAGNVIGGGDWAKDRILVNVVRCLAEGRPRGAAIPAPCALGSTFWSRWPATSPWPRGCSNPTIRPGRKPGISAPCRATNCPSAASWNCSSGRGAAGRGRTRAIRVSRTKPTCCGSRSTRRSSNSAGGRDGALRKPCSGRPIGSSGSFRAVRRTCCRHAMRTFRRTKTNQRLLSRHVHTVSLALRSRPRARAHARPVGRTARRAAVHYGRVRILRDVADRKFSLGQ